MRYVYKRLDDECRRALGYDGHAVHALTFKNGGVVSATCVHRRGMGVKTLGGDSTVESGGGIRFAPKDGNDMAALSDCLGLATTMSKKFVGLFGDSELALGGAKTVVFTHNAPCLEISAIARKEFWRVFGQEIMGRIGTYLTAEDIVTNKEDLAYLAEYAPRGLVTGHTDDSDPSPITARSTQIGMEEGARECFGVDTNPYDLSFVVQGVGNVGSEIVKLLWKKNARNITISDKKPERIKAAMRNMESIRVVDHSKALGVEADVLMPCALGGVLNEKTIPGLSVSVIAGCANNPLATPKDGVRLHQRGIFYVPDYFLNAGGLAQVIVSAITGGDIDELLERIRDTLQRVFAESGATDIAPSVVAENMVRELVAKLRPAA